MLKSTSLLFRLTCVCSCCLWSCRSDLGTGSWHTSHREIFLLQWISWVVKLASGMSCLLKGTKKIKKPFITSIYKKYSSGDAKYSTYYIIPTNCHRTVCFHLPWFCQRLWGKSNTLVTNQQVVRRKIHLNQLSGEFGVHMSYSLKLKNMCDWFVKKVAFEHRATIIFFFFIELY